VNVNGIDVVWDLPCSPSPPQVRPQLIARPASRTSSVTIRLLTYRSAPCFEHN
jgi:hypothetical protein